MEGRGLGEGDIGQSLIERQERGKYTGCSNWFNMKDNAGYWKVKTCATETDSICKHLFKTRYKWSLYHVSRNIEARSRNKCCRRKAISIT